MDLFVAGKEGRGMEKSTKKRTSETLKRDGGCQKKWEAACSSGKGISHHKKKKRR